MTTHDLAVAFAKRLEEEGITDEEVERIIHDAKEEARKEIAKMKGVDTMEYEIDECAYGKYCMCATCSFQNDCSSNCADCMSNNKQIHDIWSCTKYMRKEHLREGADDE